MMRTYEELTGARGRRIFYRAKRYKAEDVFPRIAPQVEIDRRPVILHDLSMTGLAAFASDSGDWSEDGAHDVSLRVDLGDRTLYDGDARLCRIEPSPLGVKIALNLTSGYLDIPSIAGRHRIQVAESAFSEGAKAVTDRIDPEYRLLCADVQHFLRYYGNILERAEAGRKGGDGGLEELLAACEERALPEWRQLWHRANALVAPLIGDPVAWQAAKQYTELQLTPEFLNGPIWRRSYRKPLGYPGDFEMMRQVYAWRREGTSAFGKLVHRLGLDVAECIATRMSMVQRTIAETVAAKAAAGGDGPARIMTLGCGPAEEVFGYLGAEALPGPAAFTLVDQEQDALAHAYERIYPLTMRHRGRATVRCLQASFAEMMKIGPLVDAIPPQDLIYSVGLVDYLSDRRARDLAAALFAKLAPGGRLVIGNMKDTQTGNLWPMEFICDWTLHYRSEAGMLDMAEGLDAADCAVETDPTGRVYLLRLRAP